MLHRINYSPTRRDPARPLHSTTNEDVRIIKRSTSATMEIKQMRRKVINRRPPSRFVCFGQRYRSGEIGGLQVQLHRGQRNVVIMCKVNQQTRLYNIIGNNCLKLHAKRDLHKQQFTQTKYQECWKTGQPAFTNSKPTFTHTRFVHK